MRKLLIGALFVFVGGCDFSPLDPGPTPNQNRNIDVVELKQLLRANGLWTGDSSDTIDTTIAKILKSNGGGEFPQMNYFTLEGRGITSFTFTKATTEFKEIKTVVLSRNELTEVPEGVHLYPWGRVYLDSNKICTVEASPEVEYMDNLAPSWRNTQICP